MWCSSCQQDVPAYSSPEDHRIRCIKCRTEIKSRGADAKDSPEPAEECQLPDVVTQGTMSADRGAALDPPPFDFDAWEWDELREANRAVQTWGTKSPPEQALASSAFEGSLTLPRAASRTRQKNTRVERPRSRHVAYFSWTTLSLGVMACVFGGVLLTWSFLTDRAELWSLGLPFAIGGQVALVLGLVLQLDGLWQSNHEAAESLSNLDEQLVELRRATSQISSSHSGPSQSFYFHLAEGCSPHMLLADLKGQLDLLALRLADDD